MNEVSRTTCVSKGCVSKVIHHCQQYETAETFSSGGKHSTKVADGVLQVVKLANPQNK